MSYNYTQINKIKFCSLYVGDHPTEMPEEMKSRFRTNVSLIGHVKYRFYDEFSIKKQYFCEVDIIVYEYTNAENTYYDISYNCQYGQLYDNKFSINGTNELIWNKRHPFWHSCNPLYNRDSDMFVSSFRSKECSNTSGPSGTGGEIIYKNTLTEKLVEYLLMEPNELQGHIGNFMPIDYKIRTIHFISNIFD